MAGIKVTVEFMCNNMCDAKTIVKEFDGDVKATYEAISDDYNDSVFNFCQDGGTTTKIEPILTDDENKEFEVINNQVKKK